jgi:hypothetical protein
LAHGKRQPTPQEEEEGGGGDDDDDDYDYDYELHLIKEKLLFLLKHPFDDKSV